MNKALVFLAGIIAAIALNFLVHHVRFIDQEPHHITYCADNTREA
jgi:hypothetical protein